MAKQAFKFSDIILQRSQLNYEMMLTYVALGGSAIASFVITGGGALYIIKKPPTPVINAENLGVIFICCGLALFTATALTFRQIA